MRKFILTEQTQLVRELEVHDAARDMAHRLGMSGKVETRVGDFRKNGSTRGFTGKPSMNDMLIEVYVVPLKSYTLSMEEENLALRAALDGAQGNGAADTAVEAYRERIRKASEIKAPWRTRPIADAGADR